jgi:hypothetical protein
MSALAVLSRLVFGLTSLAIVVLGALHAWSIGAPLLALAALVFFPVTFFVYPWIGGLQLLWVVSMVAFWVGNAAGASATR